jgi:hypothetical protein
LSFNQSNKEENGMSSKAVEKVFKTRNDSKTTNQEIAK